MGLLESVMDRLSGDRKKSKYTPESMEIKGKDTRSAYIQNEFDKALAFEEDNREWESENWLMYSGFSDGQWPAKIVADMKEQGRNVPQFNFVRSKIDGLAGSIVKNWFDVDFVPVDGKYSNMTNIIKELFYADKELMDWDHAYLQSVVDGLVYRGIEQMVISERYNPMGNIGFERVVPGHLLLDPKWITNNSADIKQAWKTSYLTPREIMNMYNEKSELIRDQVEFMAKFGATYDNGDDTRGFPHFNAEEIYGTQYQVIEYHHIERERKNADVVSAGNPSMIGAIVPDGDDDSRRDWLILNGAEDVVSIPYDVDNYYITTICPQLVPNGMLEDRKHEIQIGRLPFFVWSSARINGKSSGIVDLLYHIQQVINKRESLIDHMIATSANGAVAVDPQIVNGDHTKMKSIEKNWNVPGFKFWSDVGELASGRRHFEELPRSQFPSDIVNELNRMVDYLDRVSKQPAAMDARNEAAHETGILFARKQIQAEINQTTMIKNLEQYWNEKGEAYLLAAKALYGTGYREIRSANGKETIVLNGQKNTPYGTQSINNISLLPRHKVIVSQSPQGVTVKATERAVSAELMRSLPAENAASRAMLSKKIMNTMDYNDADRQELVETSELELQVAKEQLLTTITTLRAQRAQMESGMQQMAAAQQAQAAPQQPQAERGALPGQEIPLQ